MQHKSTSARLTKLEILIFSIITLLFISCDNDIKKDDVFKLPSNIINKISIDSNGVKWIATAKGLVSYDGLKWTDYTENPFLNNLAIADIAIEKSSIQNKIWIASDSGATSFVFENRTNISNMINFNFQHDSILDNKILALNVSSDNIKYIGTPKGLSILKDSMWTDYFGVKKNQILSKYEISSIASANDGWVYAATKGGGVSRFKYTDAVSGATTFNQPWAYGLQSDTVFTVFVDQDSHQWYGTNHGLAYHSSPNTKSDWTSYSHVDGLICDTVYAITKDLTGKIWIGTHKGISILSENKWQNITVMEGLVDNKVNTITVDLDGSIWIGTNNGISHYANGIWKNIQ